MKLVSCKISWTAQDMALTGYGERRRKAILPEERKDILIPYLTKI